MFDENRYYKTVRLTRKETSHVTHEQGHSQYAASLLTGRISGVIVAQQPLHIGTGLFVPPEEAGIENDAPLIKSFARVHGEQTIPGSSLKGPVRSLVETITHSCVNKTRKRWERYEKSEYGECRYNSQRRQGEICVACRMFGAMGFEGHVHFADAPKRSGETDVYFIPAQYQPKGDRERRHYPHDLQDRRNPQWPLEVALPQSAFSFQLQYQNLSKAELGLLLIALGQSQPPICLKIGAGKNSGLGGIRFTALNVEQLDAQALYAAYESESAWTPVDVAACVAASKELLRADDALGRLQADLGCDFFGK